MSIPIPTDLERAIFFANRALDEPNADPDDDLRTVSRQFLRALERLASAQPAGTPEQEAAARLVDFIDEKKRYILAELETGGAQLIELASKLRAAAPQGSQPPREREGQKETCKHCGRPIEMRAGQWRHVGYRGAYCFKPAEPALAGEREPESGVK